VDTGSPDELLDELLLLPPQAVRPRASAATNPADDTPRTVELRAPHIYDPLPGEGPAAPALLCG
jgi:hypothetical protein